MAATYDVELPHFFCSQPVLDSLDNYRKRTHNRGPVRSGNSQCDLPHQTHTHMFNTYNTDTLRNIVKAGSQQETRKSCGLNLFVVSALKNVHPKAALKIFLVCSDRLISISV